MIESTNARKSSPLRMPLKNVVGSNALSLYSGPSGPPTRALPGASAQEVFLETSMRVWRRPEPGEPDSGRTAFRA